MPVTTLSPEERIARRIRKLEKDAERRRTWESDTTGRLDQVRRSMGFNGKVDDPDIEGDLAAGFRELRLLAKSRRETETVDRARQTLKAHYISRLPKWLVVVARQLTRKAVWAIVALISAFIWGFGNRLSDTLHAFLHARHWLGQ